MCVYFHLKLATVNNKTFKCKPRKRSSATDDNGNNISSFMSVLAIHCLVFIDTKKNRLERILAIVHGVQDWNAYGPYPLSGFYV
jgi:hypothetical protein